MAMAECCHVASSLAQQRNFGREWDNKVGDSRYVCGFFSPSYYCLLFPLLLPPLFFFTSFLDRWVFGRLGKGRGTKIWD